MPSVLWASPTSFGFPVVLNLSAFSPPIAKTDKNLSGWQASLLNAMGRTVLVNSVLHSALIYIMSAMLPPPGVVEKLDKRRRAFLWSGEETASGAQCLIAWDRVQLPKDQGGLGVKNLQILNQCLLLKLLHRLHHPSDSSWANWVLAQVNLATLAGADLGERFDSIRKLLSVYRAISSSVGNGISTAFWHDNWLSVGRLCDAMPALYSHSTAQNSTVAETLAEPLIAQLC